MLLPNVCCTFGFETIFGGGASSRILSMVLAAAAAAFVLFDLFLADK